MTGPHPPSEASLRLAERANWGQRPEAEPTAAPDIPPPAVANNCRPIGKGKLLGAADITVTKWRFVFYGCLYHRKGEREWISFPGKEWIDKDGHRKFSNLCEFINHGDAKRFREVALEAVQALAAAAAEKTGGAT
jgi:hypothetical protein